VKHQPEIKYLKDHVANSIRKYRILYWVHTQVKSCVSWEMSRLNPIKENISNSLSDYIYEKK